MVVIKGVCDDSSLSIPLDDSSMVMDNEDRECMGMILSGELSRNIACYLTQ
jgi:hypothetical protein